MRLWPSLLAVALALPASAAPLRVVELPLLAPPAPAGPLAPAGPSAPQMPPPATVSLPAALPSALPLPGLPAAPEGPAAPAQLLSAALPPAQDPAAPGGGRAAPADAGRLFDGGAAFGRAPADPEALPALDPAAQLDASGFYAPVAARYGWERAGQPGLRWLGFYRDLYRSLAASLPAGHPYRSETERGPVFFVGGSDAAMAILNLPRSTADSPVNLFAKSAGVDPLELWTHVSVRAAGGAQREIGLDPESTDSLVRMARARNAGAADALDAAHANVLLKWHALALTPDGLEVRALDARSAADLREGTLRLSDNRGPLDAYELHYNLILAYRALEESPRPWAMTPGTRELIARAAAALPRQDVAEALGRASMALSQGRGITRAEAVKRLLDFAGKRLGLAARLGLSRAAQTLAPDRGGLDQAQAQQPRPGTRAELSRLAAPWRTQEHLDALAREPRAPGEAFKFALIGDAEPGRFWVWRALFNRPGVFARLLKSADAQPVDFILQLGDMVSRGVVRNFLSFFGQLASLAPRKPYLTVIGNHDRRSPHGVTDSRLYRSLFGATDYVFDRGGWRFVVLDSSAQRVTQAQLRWLDRALDTPLKKVVFTHVPPAGLSKWTDWGRFKDAAGFQGGESFARIVARRGVERVYVGHVHALDVQVHRGVTYVLTGGGGSPLYPTKAGDARHHTLVVEAGPDGLKETVHPLDGAPRPLALPLAR